MVSEVNFMANPDRFLCHLRIRTIKRFVIVAALFACVILLPCKKTWCQTVGTGAIQGTVSDESGAVVAGASVTATNPSTGYTVSQQTSAKGYFLLSQLPPAHYTVTIGAANFKTSVLRDVVVNALSTAPLNTTLKIGSANQTVSVSSLPPQLNTTTGSLDITIPNSTYTSLPLAMNGGPKDITAFVTLLPGTGNGGNNTVKLNGGPNQSSVIYLNGMPASTSEGQGDSLQVNTQNSTQVVDQFQVITSGVPAYYTGQGVTNYVLKSGTNSFHGNVYENIRNTVFDAAGYFSKTTPVERQNEFGGTLGGPIIKNRLFFFGNYDGYRYTQGANPKLLSLPTEAERNGDFRALPTKIYDPATTKCTAAGVCTRQAFLDNIIPPNRISAVSKSFQSYLPQTINSSIQNNYYGALTGGFTDNMYMGKLDFTASQKHHLYLLGEYGKEGLTSLEGSYLPLPYTPTFLRSHAISLGQLGDTYAITQNLVNVFAYQYTQWAQYNSLPTKNGTYVTTAGLTGAPAGLASQAFPPITFTGPNSPTSWGTNTTSDSYFTTNTIQDNVQWIHGNHSLTVGTTIMLETDDIVKPSLINAIRFNHTETSGFGPTGALLTTTGNAYASYLLGDVDSAAIQDNSYVEETAGRLSNYAFYAQDDWRVTPKLTVNLGLRYEIPKPFTFANNYQSWFNPNLPNPAVENHPGALQFAGSGPYSCHCRTQNKTHYLAFDPRVGFAYSITPKIVLRGSYTIIHFNAGALGSADSDGTGMLGYQAAAGFQSPDAGITPAFNWITGFPAYQHPPFISDTLNTGYNTTTGPSAGAVTYNRPNTGGRPPYTQNWNLTLEQQITPTTVWSLSYSASASRFLPIKGGLGIYSDEIEPQYMALGSLLQQKETPTTLAEAQKIIPGINVPYSNFSGSIGQMLRPFPQYSGVSDPYADFGSSQYNSLQTYVQKKMSDGLYFLFAYTWSKLIDNSDASVDDFGSPGASGLRTAYNLNAERSVDSNDIPQVISFSYVYALPFGHGHAIGGDSRWMNLVFGGLQLSGILRYSSGTPLGTITGVCNVPYSGGCYANYNPSFSGSARINGAYGSGQPSGPNPQPYVNVNAFQPAASFTFGNTPRTMAYGLRAPWNLNEDVSLGKNFNLPLRSVLRVQADAFNVFNRTVFGGIPTDVSSANFGTVTTQTNGPRNLQFEAYIRF